MLPEINYDSSPAPVQAAFQTIECNPETFGTFPLPRPEEVGLEAAMQADRGIFAGSKGANCSPRKTR